MPQIATVETISPSQSHALAALLEGASVTAAAERAGVDRATVHRWLRDDEAFIAELNAARAELLALVRSNLGALGGTAVALLAECLDPATTGVPKALRLKAAVAVLKMLGCDRPEPLGPTDPRDVALHRRAQAVRRQERRGELELSDLISRTGLGGADEE